MAGYKVMTLVLALAGVLIQEPVANEVRGLWILRSSMTSPEAIAELVRTAKDGGYNTLLIQVRSRGDAYYAAQVDPRAADLTDQPPDFDPLATALAAGHAAGLKVHAWINVSLVSSSASVPRAREHIVARHPEWLMVPRALAAPLAKVDPQTPAYLTRLVRWYAGERESVEGLFLSPIPEGSQDYTVSVVADLMQSYALDGAHLDYIRYPSGDFDYSAASLEAFRSSRAALVPAAERERLDRAALTDPTVWTRTFPVEWTAFRTQRLTTLVQRIRRVVKAERPNAILSSAVVPDPALARERYLQDWPAWAEAGTMDVICPMAYATTVEAFSAQVSAAAAGAHGRPLWMGIGAWRLPVGQTASHLAAARRAGAAGVVLFSYDSLLTAGTRRGGYFTQLRPALLNDGRGGQRQVP